MDKLCPRIVLVHSQSGAYGFQGPRSASRQGQGTSCIEPTLAGDKNKISTLTKRPLLFVIGDNAKEQPRWSKTRSADVEYANALKGAGGSVDFVDLPDLGIKGNSHMMMINKNSDQIAGLIGKWLSSKGFCD